MCPRASYLLCNDSWESKVGQETGHPPHWAGSVSIPPCFPGSFPLPGYKRVISYYFCCVPSLPLLQECQGIAPSVNLLFTLPDTSLFLFPHSVTLPEQITYLLTLQASDMPTTLSTCASLRHSLLPETWTISEYHIP